MYNISHEWIRETGVPFFFLLVGLITIIALYGNRILYMIQIGIAMLVHLIEQFLILGKMLFIIAIFLLILLVAGTILLQYV